MPLPNSFAASNTALTPPTRPFTIPCIMFGTASARPPTISGTASMICHSKSLAAVNSCGIPSARPPAIAVMISGSALASATMISGNASKIAMNSFILPSIISGIPVIKPCTIASMICGSAAISASIIVGIASTIPISSCMAPSIIRGIDCTRAFTILVMISGNASKIATITFGIACTMPESNCMPASMICGTFCTNILTISTTTFTMVGSSVGSACPIPLARLVMISAAPDTSKGSTFISPSISVSITLPAVSMICGRFSVMELTSATTMSVATPANCGIYSPTVFRMSPTVAPIASPIFPKSPPASCSNDVKFLIMSVALPITFCFIPANTAPTSICIPSIAELKERSLPASPLSIVSAISAAAPLQSDTWAFSVSNSSPVPFRRAFTAAMSVLLKIVLMVLVFSESLIPSIEALRSIRMSFKSLIFPWLSVVSTPSCFNAFAAVSVGADKDSNTFRKCVPPSLPLIPLFASTPNSAFMVSKLIPTVDAVPATTRVASPNCCTDVLDFWEVFAISSI